MYKDLPQRELEVAESIELFPISVHSFVASDFL